MFIPLANFPSPYRPLLGSSEVKEQTRRLVTNMAPPLEFWQKLPTALSYKVLKARPKTLNKAKITIAWVEQVINPGSLPPAPAVPPQISFLVKKTTGTRLVFEARNLLGQVVCTLRSPQPTRSGFGRGTVHEAQIRPDSKRSGRTSLKGKKVGESKLELGITCTGWTECPQNVESTLAPALPHRHVVYPSCSPSTNP